MLWNGSGTLHPRPDDEIWITKLRSQPAAVCPSEQDLSLFAREPLAVADGNFMHIVRGCDHCRHKLRRMLLTTRPVSA